MTPTHRLTQDVRGHVKGTLVELRGSRKESDGSWTVVVRQRDRYGKNQLTRPPAEFVCKFDLIERLK